MANGTLTDQTRAIVRDNVNTLYGLVASRPALLVTDSKEVTYACDVDVGITTPYPNGKNQQVNALFGVPGTRNYQIDDSLTIGTILRNVIIANNNSALLYADVGNPVIVSRTGTGQWQVTGFAAEMPGTRTRIPVDLKAKSIGPGVSLGVSIRPLTLGELATLGGGFGICPLGASGVFIGGVFQRLVI
jgi:hypothetical protein